MKALDLIVPARPRSLSVDLVADLACPWSFLGKRRLERALQSVQGIAPSLRWHGHMPDGPGAAGREWREALAARLPHGIGVEFAERSLTEAGRELGIHFAFERLGTVPDTAEAHRLVKLAAREGLHMAAADALFRAYFEAGRDIGALDALLEIGRESGLSAGTLELLRSGSEGRGEVAADHERLHALGVVTTPNLLLNGSVLVTGPADVAVYVQALDQALFPAPEGAGQRAPTLH